MLLADALSSFPATNSGQDQKTVTSSERTRISYFTALTGAAYVVLRKENHMQLTEAATSTGNPGKPTCPGVPWSVPASLLSQPPTPLSSTPEHTAANTACHAESDLIRLAEIRPRIVSCA